MIEIKKMSYFDRIFRGVVGLKGLFGITNVIGGLLLLFVSSAFFNRIIETVLRPELIEDPRDLIANFLASALSGLVTNTKFYGAIYLLIHGIVNFALVVGILKEKLWVYPVAEVVLTLSVIYQFRRYAHTHSGFLLFFTLWDILVIVLIFIEYGRLKKLEGLKRS